MVSPSDSIRRVAEVLDESTLVTDDASYLLEEADLTGEHANVPLPVIELQAFDVDHVQPNNSDLVDYVVDDAGNRVGRVYAAEYELEIQLDIWTEYDGEYDVDEMAKNVRDALYQYSSYGPALSMHDEIFRFTIDTSERQDDLVQTPTVRRWRMTLDLWAYEEFKTTEEYIVDVNVPQAND